MLLTLIALTSAAVARPAFGGFGHLSNGFVVGNLGGLNDAASQAIGDSAPDIGLTWGGGGRMLMFQRLLLGGRGYAIYNASNHTARGSIDLQGGGGGIDIGGVLFSGDKDLHFLYAGAQGLGFEATVRDNTAKGTRFGSRDVPPGRELSMSSGAWLVDLGMGSHHMLHEPDLGGGLSLGAEAGVLVSLAGAPWSDEAGVENRSLPAARASMLYFRLNVGGGGFLYTD